MSTEVSNAKPSGLTFAVPARIAALIKAKGMKNIADKQTVNSLTFGGKVWAIHINGEKKIVQKAGEDGELENVQIMRVIVLNQAKDRGRSYYDGPFDPASPRAPDCWSTDSKRPSSNVAEPQSKSCDLCPKSIKGSRIVDGKDMVACASHKLLVVTSANNPKFPAMRLKLPATSIWDKQDDESAAAGWYGWENYCDLLRANGVGFTGVLVTKIRFANTNYPKLQFARGDFLEDDIADAMWTRSQTEEVTNLLADFKPSEGAAGKPLPKDEPEVAGPDPAADAFVKKQMAERIAAADAAAAAEQQQIEEGERQAAIQRAAQAEEAAARRNDRIAEARALLASLEGDTEGPTSTAPVAATTGQTTTDAASAVTAQAAEAEKKRTRRTKAEMEAARAAEAAANLEKLARIAETAAKAPATPPAATGTASSTTPQTGSAPSSVEDDGNWDEPKAPTLQGEIVPKAAATPVDSAMPVRETKAPEIPSVAPVEVPSALAGILGKWA